MHWKSLSMLKMFDGLLKSRFYTRCKSAIKLTRTRIEHIKRKKNAMQKYLRNDIADLLKYGLDSNAYDRAEGLLIEQNLSSCYDFVEQSCLCISSHLSAMNKQRECPEECREAIPSLIYAAARFADLPELRELRSIFAERYGNSLEPYISNEFVEKLELRPPTKDMKLQLIQDIALESGIEWDSKALEQKLYKPPAIEQDWSKNTNGDRHKLHERKDEYNEGRLSFETPEKNLKEDDDKEHLVYSSIPPPYIINPKLTENETNLEVPPMSDKSNGHLDEEDYQPEDELAREAKTKPISVRRRPLKPQPGHENLETTKGHRRRKLSSSENKGAPEISNNYDHTDEEEKEMDRLLLHYSTKQSAAEISEAESRNRNRGDYQKRGKSLPDEPRSPDESTKGHVRASSFQPEMSNQTVHVHPKLPDYDDLVARLAALKGIE